MASEPNDRPAPEPLDRAVLQASVNIVKARLAEYVEAQRGQYAVPWDRENKEGPARSSLGQALINSLPEWLAAVDALLAVRPMELAELERHAGQQSERIDKFGNTERVWWEGGFVAGSRYRERRLFDELRLPLPKENGLDEPCARCLQPYSEHGDEDQCPTRKDK